MWLQLICLYLSPLEESLHEAAYFRTISQRSKLVVDLVQFYKPNENEEPVAPVLRAMEEIRKLKAEVILLYTNKESVELLLKQVRECAALVQGVIILFVLKLKGWTEYVTRLNETARCTGSKIQPKQPESRKYTFYGLYFLAPHFFWHLFFVFEFDKQFNSNKIWMYWWFAEALSTKRWPWEYEICL